MHEVVTQYFWRKAHAKSVGVILREASLVLKAAQKYAPELVEIGITDNELCQMRRLVARVAAKHLAIPEHKTNVVSELNELQFASDVILRAVELRFGGTSEIFGEFCNPEGQEPDVYSDSSP